MVAVPAVVVHNNSAVMIRRNNTGTVKIPSPVVVYTEGEVCGSMALFIFIKAFMPHTTHSFKARAGA